MNVGLLRVCKLINKPIIIKLTTRFLPKLTNNSTIKQMSSVSTDQLVENARNIQPSSLKRKLDDQPNTKSNKKQKNPTEPKSSTMVLNEIKPGLKYNLIESESVPNSKVFVIEVMWEGQPFKGCGKNKRIAKQEAALAVLQSMPQLMEPHKVVHLLPPPTLCLDFTSDDLPGLEPQVPYPTNVCVRIENSRDLVPNLPKSPVPETSTQPKNPIMILNERIPGLRYELTKNNQNDFEYKVEINEITFFGNGKGKKQAKRDVAEKILNSGIIEDNQIIKVKEISNSTKDTSSQENQKTEALEIPLPPTEPETKSQPIVAQNAVGMLNQLHPSLLYTYEAVENSSKTHLFTAFTEVNGNTYKGFGRSKKLAKHGVAGCVLRAVYNIDCLNLDKQTVQSTTTVNSPIPIELPDIISNSVWSKFSDLTDNFTSEHSKFLVISGIVMTDSTTDTETVISLATGSKSINGEYISHQGTVLFDCHAEVISKRGLRKFLYQQILLHNDNCLKDDSIFEPLPDAGLRLKPNIQFHLYINTAPCGDSRIFSKDTDSSLDDNHPNRMNRGLLRTKIESGAGTIPVDKKMVLENDKNQHWDAIVSGERLLTMSCSDKIAKWNTLGIQGSLLSLYIEPIYLSSIIIGALYHHEHLERGVYGRFKRALEQTDELDDDLNKFQIQRPMLAAASSADKRVAQKAPKYCFHWTQGDAEPSIIEMKTGKKYLGESSNLCKQEMFKMFEKVSESNACQPRVAYNYVKGTTSYKNLKEQATDYQQMKLKLMEGLVEMGYGKWIGKPTEVELFTMNKT